jgi:uncharacterized protein YdhG (YjbR/CyaY superfamily)
MNKALKTVDAYIAKAPISVHKKLKEVRTAIRKAAPKAQEKISYGMPYYSHQGRLVYFRLGKGYIGLYIPPPVVAEHQKELKGYYSAGATVHLPLDKKTPVGLIQKLVKARMRKNEKKK